MAEVPMKLEKNIVRSLGAGIGSSFSDMGYSRQRRLLQKHRLDRVMRSSSKTARAGNSFESLLLDKFNAQKVDTSPNLSVNRQEKEVIDFLSDFWA